MKFTSLALLALFAAGHASAQSYVGASVGQSRIDRDITTELITSGAVDEKDSAWKIYFGHMFTPHLGIETAYIALGDAAYSGDFAGAAVSGGRVEVSGFNVAGVASYPFGARLAVFAKLGLFFWTTEANDFTAGIGQFSAQEDGSDVSFGIGVRYGFTTNLALRAEWERFTVELFEKADADLVSVGLEWRF